MRAMILCAGLGTRLRPLTARWPKPAIPLLGQPLIRFALGTLAGARITEVGVNTHHLPEVMEEVARRECARLGLALTVVTEEGEIQGTGGGIRGLQRRLAGGDFLVLNGDVLFALDLGGVIDAHRASGVAASMVLLPMPAGETFNAVELDSHGRVRRIAGKGPPRGEAGGSRLTPWHFSGVHVLTPEVFEHMAPDGPEDINHDVYLRMLERGVPIGGLVLTSREVGWSDLGTPLRYAAAHHRLLAGQFPLAPFGEASPFHQMTRGPGNAWVHPTAKLGDVKVSGPAWFGEGCELGPGCRVGAFVSVGRQARVGASAWLNRTVVLDGAEVPPGVLYEDVIVAPGGVVVSTAETTAADGR